MESQTQSSTRAPRELQNWRVQGNPPTLRQPCANPSPTFRQPFANLFCQPLSNPLFPWTPGTCLETRVNGFLSERRLIRLTFWDTLWEQFGLSDQSALIDASLWRKPLKNLCKASNTQPKTQRSKPLWERNGLNISRFKLFARISYLGFWDRPIVSAGEQFNFCSGTLGSRRPTILEFRNTPGESKWYVQSKDPTAQQLAKGVGRVTKSLHSTALQFGNAPSKSHTPSARLNLWTWERERERETERKRRREKKREREKGIWRETERERERDREKKKGGTERERERATERDREKQRGIDRYIHIYI